MASRGGKGRKVGRNKAKCKVYRDRRTKERNKARKLEREINAAAKRVVKGGRVIQKRTLTTRSAILDLGLKGKAVAAKVAQAPRTPVFREYKPNTQAEQRLKALQAYIG